MKQVYQIFLPKIFIQFIWINFEWRISLDTKNNKYNF